MPSNPRLALLRSLYEAYDSADLATILAALADNIQWRDQLAGTWLSGKRAVAAYWDSAAGLIRTEVAIKSIKTLADGRVQVHAHQTVRNPEGHIWSAQMVNHTYSFDDNNRIVRMEPESLG